MLSTSYACALNLDCHLGDTHTTRRARLTSKRRITTVTKRVSVKPLEGVLSGGKLSFMQDGCSWPVHVNILRHRYVGSHTTLCLYHGGCGSTTTLNLQSTTPPLEPQPRLNHPNPATTPTTEVDYVLFFYGIDPVLASLSNLKIAKISHCLRAQAIGHTQFGLVNRFAQRCASPKRLRSLRFCGRKRGEVYH